MITRNNPIKQKNTDSGFKINLTMKRLTLVLFLVIISINVSSQNYPLYDMEGLTSLSVLRLLMKS